MKNNKSKVSKRMDYETKYSTKFNYGMVKNSYII